MKCPSNRTFYFKRSLDFVRYFLEETYNFRFYALNKINIAQMHLAFSSFTGINQLSSKSGKAAENLKDY